MARCRRLFPARRVLYLRSGSTARLLAAKPALHEIVLEEQPSYARGGGRDLAWGYVPCTGPFHASLNRRQRLRRGNGRRCNLNSALCWKLSDEARRLAREVGRHPVPQHPDPCLIGPGVGWPREPGPLFALTVTLKF